MRERHSVVPDAICSTFGGVVDEVAQCIQSLGGLFRPHEYVAGPWQTPVDVVKQVLQFRSEWNEVLPLRQQLDLVRRVCSILLLSCSEANAAAVSRRLCQVLSSPMRDFLAIDSAQLCRSIAVIAEEDATLFDAVGVHLVHMSPVQRVAMREFHQTNPEITLLMSALVTSKGFSIEGDAPRVADFHNQLKVLIGSQGLVPQQLEVQLVAMVLGAPVPAKAICTQLGSANQGRPETVNQQEHQQRNPVKADDRLKKRRLAVWESFLQVLRFQPLWGTQAMLQSLVDRRLVHRIHRWFLETATLENARAPGDLQRCFFVDLLPTAIARNDHEVSLALSSLDHLADFAARLGVAQSTAIGADQFQFAHPAFEEMFRSLFNYWNQPDVLQMCVCPALEAMHGQLLNLRSQHAQSTCLHQIFNAEQMAVFLQYAVDLSAHTFCGSDMDTIGESLRHASTTILALIGAVVNSEFLKATLSNEGDVLKQVLQFLPRYNAGLWCCTSGIQMLASCFGAVRSREEYEALSMALQCAQSYEDVAGMTAFLGKAKEVCTVVPSLVEAAKAGGAELECLLYYCEVFRVKSSMDFCWHLAHANEPASAAAAFACLANFGFGVPRCLTRSRQANETEENAWWRVLFNLRFSADRGHWIAQTANMLGKEFQALLAYVQSSRTFPKMKGFHSRVTWTSCAMRVLTATAAAAWEEPNCMSNVLLPPACILAQTLADWLVEAAPGPVPPNIDDEEALLALAGVLCSFLGQFETISARASQMLLSTCISARPVGQKLRAAADQMKALPSMCVEMTPTELSNRVSWVVFNRTATQFGEVPLDGHAHLNAQSCVRFDTANG
ncbi:unnamed protein product [Prorocentrum cordatum]|uniref:Uncharacterized protein n=1 Tax=Prorocentrum cordatum TaxID=2364126 RepID=A0ABN9R4A9_9DINO|nr:unnamed protein product [Polarella glacialis]